MSFKNLIPTVLLGFLTLLLVVPVSAGDEGVQFSVEPQQAEPEESDTFPVTVLNYESEDATVGVSVPTRDDCEYFQVREDRTSGSFTSSTTFNVEPGNESSPSETHLDLRVDMPDRSGLDENNSVTCGLSTSSTVTGVDDLEVVVQSSGDVFYVAATSLDNELGTGMWLVEEYNLLSSSSFEDEAGSELVLKGYELLLAVLFLFLVLAYFLLRG